MAVHASHMALPFPVKGARFTVYLPYLDADGDPTDPASGDTEISKDGGAPADCTEEVTAITGTGTSLMTFTGDETNCSGFAVNAKVGSGNAKATLATFYPRVLPALAAHPSGTAQAGAAGTITLASGAPAFDISGCIIKTTGGTGGAGGSGSQGNQARVVTAYNTSTKVATVVPDWETTPDNTTTYAVLMTDLAGNAMLANALAVNGGLLSGYNATLKLLQLDVENSAGSAARFASTGGNGHGAVLTGNGSGEGLSSTGGATGNGAEFIGGATSGAGLKGTATNGNSPGGQFVGQGTGVGMALTGGGVGDGGPGLSALGQGATAPGIFAAGTSGPGVWAYAGSADDPGILSTGSGAGAGAKFVGGDTGHGLELVGGATSGDGIHSSATDGDGMDLAGGTNGHGLRAAGAGSGEGISGTGGGTGHGMGLVGGATSGDGLNATATTDGDGIQAAGASSGKDFNASTIHATFGNTIADYVLRRSWASAAASSFGDAKSFRSLLGAVAKLVNKVAVATGTLTVYEADDTTSLGTQTVGTDAAAEPIVSVDTA